MPTVVLQNDGRYTGGVVGVSGNVAHGWAMDTEAPDASVVVELLVDGESNGVIIADQLQPTEETSGVSFHGFSFVLSDATLRSGASIVARVANQNIVLGAPIQLVGHQDATPNVVSSQIWYHGGLVISGWLWDASSPGKQLTLHVRHDKQLIMKTVADRPHAALVWMKSSEHGFQIDLPIEFADGKSREIFLENESGENLPGSPITVCCYAEGLSGLLQNLWPKAALKDPSTKKQLDALTDLVRAQERFNPISIGFSQYPQWFSISEARQTQRKPTSRQLKTAVIIQGEPGPELDKSIGSLDAQRHLPQSVVHKTGDLREALLRASENGVELIVGMVAGDRLAPTYVDSMASAFDTPDVRFAYSDCDQDGPEGERTNPWLKPGWDPDLFFGIDLVTSGSAWSTRQVVETLNQNSGVGIPDWQTFSVLVAKSLSFPEGSAGIVKHVPAVLYHRRVTAPTFPYDVEMRSAHCLSMLAQLAQQQDALAEVSSLPAFPGITRVKWSLPEAAPSVSLIVPTRDHYRLLSACVEGLLHRTDYPGRVEIIVVDNNSADPETLGYMETLETRGVRVLRYPKEFNYSDINNFAVSHATGEIIGLINNDIEVLHEDWLAEMVSQLLRPGVGVVGAKLLWPNKMVQHGGVVVGISSLAAHTGNHWHEADAGYLGVNQLVRRQSAVTAACLLLRRINYSAIGGLDGICFPVAFNDVDLCMRLKDRGLSIILTPHAKLIHAESASRGKEDTPAKASRAAREQMNFSSKWARPHLDDEFYHPGLTKNWAVGPYNALSII